MKRHLDCPRCSVSLETVIVEEQGLAVEIDVCNKCEGVWFDKGELEQVARFMDLGFVKTPNHPPSMRTQLEGIKCPSCKPMEIMKKSLHPKNRQIIVDSCIRCHGIWLDGGELEAIHHSGSMTGAR